MNLTFVCSSELMFSGDELLIFCGYLCSLSEGGTPPRFLIVDDGWQQIGQVKDTNCVVQEGAQ